ncbi:MAG: hypothetical protein KC478_04340 [Bacteriovoracaceae bacterium]|nr:hypothetical protein [Bacteriovoracaceae bacterium]
MKKLLALLSLLASTTTFAQIASGSLFRTTRSENPGVLQERPAATFGTIFKLDKVEKSQETTGAISSSKSEIDIKTLSFFYGGKGGKGFTTEISGELASGEKVDNVTTSGVVEKQTSESDLTFLNASIGFMNLLGVGVISVSNENTQTSTQGGSSASELELMIYTVGIKYKLGLDFGLFYQHAPLDTAGGEIDMSRVGLGIGIKTKSFHVEAAYVKNLEDEREELGGGSGAGQNVAIHSPAKLMGTFEFKLGSLTLGITSNYYMEGFFDFNNLMYYAMVLSANKENRLENSFNFSLGGEKGHSFSGGVTIASVESTESPPTLLSGQKYKTTTDIFSASVSYSYAF